MLYIKKGKTPQNVEKMLIEIRKSKTWKTISEDDTQKARGVFDDVDKTAIKEALLKEQHGLCAYCMKRIENNDSMTIEHYRPINKSKDGVLDYRNMMGCCDGGRNIDMTDEPKVLCCDASKKDAELTISPYDQTFIEQLCYTKDGIIKVRLHNTEIERQINEVLHLNGIMSEKGKLKYDTATQLVKGRRDTYSTYEKIMSELDDKYGKSDRLIGEIKKRISRIEQMEIYPEYTGVLLYYLKRRIRNRG